MYVPAAGWNLALYDGQGVTLSGSNLSTWADVNTSTASTWTANGTVAWTSSAISAHGAATFTGSTSNYLASSGVIPTFLGATSDSYTIYAVSYPTAAGSGTGETVGCLLCDFGGYFTTGFTTANHNSTSIDHYDTADKTAFTQNGGSTNGGLTGFGCPVLTVMRLNGVDAGAGTLTIQQNSGSTFTGSLGGVGPLNSFAATTAARMGASTAAMTGYVTFLMAWAGDVGNTADTAMRPWFPAALNYPALNSGGCTF